MQAKTVSVIITTRNRRDYLKQAIESVRAQTLTDWELIVVNDGSTDETQPLVDGFCKEDSRIQSIVTNHVGIAAARNLGLAKAAGRYVAFLDDDDYFTPQRLEVMAAKLDQVPEAGLVYGVSEIVNKHDEFIERFPVKPALCFLDLIEQSVIFPSALLIRREALDAAGHFNTERMTCDDYDLCLRISRLYPILFIEDIVCVHRWHPGNISLKRVQILDDENFFRLAQLKHLSEESERRAVRARVKRTAADYYLLASESMSAGDSKTAARLYRKAVGMNPRVGFDVPWLKENPDLLKILKPHLMTLYSTFKSFFAVRQDKKAPHA